MTSAPLNRALFLDRDGVINVEKNYVHRIEDFEFLLGIFELCRRASDLGYLLVVVTNQAGIGRGHYTEADFQHLTEWMVDVFRERGIVISRVYHCPYHPTAGIGPYRQESFDRKPQPGMLLRARDDLNLDLARSVLIGDKDSDMAAGLAAGIGQLIKLTPGVTSFASGPGNVTLVDTLQAASHMLRPDTASQRPISPGGSPGGSVRPADRR